jgi:hypothetical protein
MARKTRACENAEGTGLLPDQQPLSGMRPDEQRGEGIFRARMVLREQPISYPENHIGDFLEKETLMLPQPCGLTAASAAISTSLSFCSHSSD